MISVRLIALVLLAAALAGCGREAAAPTDVPPTVAPPAAPVGEFGPTERAFVELSIATDNVAVQLLDLGQRATASAVRELAHQVGAARRTELGTLRGLLDDAGVVYVDNHAGHDMPGMLTEQELGALAAAGPDFDAAFTRLLRAHVQESTTVVNSALRSVTHEQTKTVADAMARERAAELDRLDRASPG